MNLKFLKTLAYASNWMYSPPTTKPPIDWKVLHRDNELGMLTNGTTCIYSFRGTTTGADIMEDMRAFVNPSACVLSFPFNSELYSDALPLAERLMYIPQCPTYDVYFTGHSLGGSLAVTVAWIQGGIIGYPQGKVVTFGEPPSCCAKGKLVESHLRVINGRSNKHDPIPAWRDGDIGHCEDSKVLWLSDMSIDNDDDQPYDFISKNILMHRMTRYIYSLTKRDSILMEEI